MQTVLAHNIDNDTVSVVRATAIALGLPLLVLEPIEGSRSLASVDPTTGAAPGALVLVMRRPGGTAKSGATPRLAVPLHDEVDTPQDSASLSSRSISGEGGIVRFGIGDLSKKMAG